MLMAKGRPPRKYPPRSWAARLRALRDRLGITQAEAAERTGVALRTWIGWENSQREPSGPAAELLRLKFPDLK
jgi:DNA-binding transcriptional regulator YiaG